MKKVILKTFLFCLAAISIISITACGSPAPASTTPTVITAGAQSPSLASSTIPVTTEFGRMLSLVPNSWLQRKDIWFGDPGKAWELQGIDVRGIDSLRALPPEKSYELLVTQVGNYDLTRLWNTPEMVSLTGFDVWTVDRTILAGRMFSESFSINQGDFDEDLIKSKLIGQSYTSMEYGPYSYYSLNGDNQVDLKTDLGKLGVFPTWNRVAIFDETVITACNTGAINDILDVMSGKNSSVMDNAISQALAASLGEVVGGVIIDPGRVINRNPDQEIERFHFDIPSDWGLLHPYEMAGMGYKYDRKESSWLISLFYADAQAASADAEVLVNRMKSYVFYTQADNPPQGLAKRDFAFYGYSIGEPVVQSYTDGATLTVECKGNPWRLSAIEMGDLLFLVPDPSPYVAPVSSNGQLTPGSSPEGSVTPASTRPVFGQISNISIGAEPGYNDAGHQQINFNIGISNQSVETVKNVKVTISTMATNDEPKPLIVEAKPETPGHLDFAPEQSETYKVSWNYDGSQQSKEEVARLVNQSSVQITFTTPDGREMTEKLFPN